MSTQAREHVGPWCAKFKDGPLADPDMDRHFAVGPIMHEMVFAPIPRHKPDEQLIWVLVAWDSWPVGEPWDDQVRYQLVEIAGEDDPGEPIAHFEQVSP